MCAYAIFWIESLDVVIHTDTIQNIETIRWVRIPLVQKHTPLITLLFPFVTVMVVYTDMAELIEYGYNRGVSTTNNLHVR
jgi:hypothetical protein